MHEKKVEISFATYVIVNVKQDFSGAFLQKMYIAGTKNQLEFGQSI
jgi:hypothetical protein